MLDLSLPNRAAEAAPGDTVLFRFPVAAGSRIVKLRPCLDVDRRRSRIGSQMQLCKLGSLGIADRGIQRRKKIQLR